ncbi:MAG TPA: DUF1127 domain-containing protein [Xanthobacteraceae bacterium]|jgi:uncharacterized protein YjiS (DUF1127 family)|nr:DUF1127 domain-containing protein [Xanthobacteraceae bacterium]
MLLSKFISLFRSWWRYQENIQELSRLGDRELADIGISRSEIPGIAWANSRS